MITKNVNKNNEADERNLKIICAKNPISRWLQKIKKCALKSHEITSCLQVKFSAYMTEITTAFPPLFFFFFEQEIKFQFLY